MLTVCDFLPVRTVTVRPATSVLKPDGVMLMDQVLHLQRRGAAHDSLTLRHCFFEQQVHTALSFPITLTTPQDRL
jgi:hypothetical protein